MVYLAGVTDHHVEDDAMVAHIVKLVEAKAAEIDAGTTVSMDTLQGKAAEFGSER
jgi:(E)-4-hydroxy-3-methylbut-2-enyl-diphosphate synthase